MAKNKNKQPNAYVSDEEKKKNPKWFESYDWFKDIADTETMQKKFDEYAEEFDAENFDTQAEKDEAKKILDHIRDEFELGPSLKAAIISETKKVEKKEEVRKEFAKLKDDLQSFDMSFAKLDKTSGQMLKDIFDKNFSEVEIDQNGRFTEKSAGMANLYAREAIVRDLHSKPMENFLQYDFGGRDGNALDAVMEYNNFITKNIRYDLNHMGDEKDALKNLSKRYLDSANKIVKAMVKKGNAIKLNTVDDKGNVVSSEKIETRPDNSGRIDKAGMDAFNKLGLAGLRQLNNRDNVIDRQEFFANIISNGDHIVFSPKSMKEYYNGSGNARGFNTEAGYDRANRIMESIVGSKISCWDDERPHNRDKVKDLVRLYNAVKELNGDVPDKKFTASLLKNINNLRIHDYDLEGRHLQEDFIKQQKMIDGILSDIGFSKYNYWQSVERKLGRSVDTDIKISGSEFDSSLINEADTKKIDQPFDKGPDSEMSFRKKPLKIKLEEDEEVISAKKIESKQPVVSKGAITQ